MAGWFLEDGGPLLGPDKHPLAAMELAARCEDLNPAWDPVERVMAQAHALLGWPHPLREEITSRLRPGCLMQQAIDLYGEDDLIELMVFAAQTWTEVPSWDSVLRKHNKVREDLVRSRQSKVTEVQERERQEVLREVAAATPVEGADFITVDKEVTSPVDGQVRRIPCRVIPGTLETFDEAAWRRNLLREKLGEPAPDEPVPPWMPYADTG